MIDIDASERNRLTMPAADNRFREYNLRRVERMNTWIGLAEATSGKSEQDHVRFVFYWIAYEAAYKTASPGRDSSGWNERSNFHSRLPEHDGKRLANILGERKEDAHRILGLRQADPVFWERRWKVKSPEEWDRVFKGRVRRQVRRLNRAVANANCPEVSAALDDLFRNLNIVRNQIVHGGSAGFRSRGRTQVVVGSGLLKAFIPCFRGSIESNIDRDWGQPPFPRVGSEPDEECPPPWLERRHQ